MDKKFILGIGSQRAGSTFLAKLLSQHPEVAFHPLKELHYFDTLFGVRDEKTLKDFSRNQLTREINKLCDAKQMGFANPTWKWYLKSNFELYSTPIAKVNYLNLFTAANHFKGVKFTGESTPEYMLLDSVQVQQIRSVIGNAYVILICRNPIKRVISSFRLMLEYNRQNLSQAEADHLFLKLLNSDNVWMQRQLKYNAYREALERYQQEFERVLCLNYDDVVDAPNQILEQTAQFLNLNFATESMTQFFQRKINTLKVEYKPSQEVLEKLEHFLDLQVEQTNHLFGKPVVH